MYSGDIGPDGLGRDWTLDFDDIEFIWSKPKETAKARSWRERVSI